MKKSKDYCSDDLYTVGIKEDTAYPCLHFTSYHEDLKPHMPYPVYTIRRIEYQLKNTLKYINRGPFSKKLPIRRIEFIQYDVEEEIKETMTEPTVEEYMTITRLNYVSGNIENGRIELKGRFLEELRNNASSGTNGEDVIEHIGNFLKIVDLLKVPNVSDDQLRVRVFPFSLTRAASRWWKDEIDAQITT
ncbi:hypothetical protein Tco_1226313 [Tanacetum coccineum]